MLNLGYTRYTHQLAWRTGTFMQFDPISGFTVSAAYSKGGITVGKKHNQRGNEIVLELIDKTTGEVQKIPASDGEVTATSASDLRLDFPQSDILSTVRSGDDLVVTLVNGVRVVVRDFYAFDEAGEVFDEAGEVLAEAEDVGGLSAVGLGLAVVGAGVALAASGGSGGSNSDKDSDKTASETGLEESNTRGGETAPMTALEAALAKINAWDWDAGDEKVPTVKDYGDVGVTGVTADNLGSVNAMVAAAPKGEGGRLSPEEVQQLAHMGTDWQGPRSAADDVTVEKTDDGWRFKVDTDGDGSPDRTVTYSFNAEGEISEIQRDRDGDGAMQKGDRDRYEVVNEVNDKGEPVEIAYYHPKDDGSREDDPYLIHRYKKGADGLVDVEFSDSDADGTTDVIYFRRPASLDLADYESLGVTGVTADNLASVNRMVAAAPKGEGGRLSPEELQQLAHMGADWPTQGDDVDVTVEKTADGWRVEVDTDGDDSPDRIVTYSFNAEGEISESQLDRNGDGDMQKTDGDRFAVVNEVNDKGEPVKTTFYYPKADGSRETDPYLIHRYKKGDDGLVDVEFSDSDADGITDVIRFRRPASLDLDDYESLGVTGVTADNLGSVNRMVAAAPKGEGGRLSSEEVQQLAHMGADWQAQGDDVDVTVEKTADGWRFKVDTDGDDNPDRIVTYSFNNEGEISEIQRDRNGDGDMQKGDRDRYEVVNEVNDKGEPVKITYYHPKDDGTRAADPWVIHRYKKGDDGLVDVEFSDRPVDGTIDVIRFRRPASLDLADYESLGVTGVTADNLGSVNRMVAAAPKGEGGRLSSEEVQQLAHMGADWQAQGDDVDVTVEKTADGWRFKVDTDGDDNPDRIVTYSFNNEGEISEIQRDRDADGAMQKTDGDRFAVVNEVNDKGEPVKITYYHPTGDGSREPDPYLIHRYKKGDDGLVDVEFSDSDADGATDVIYFRRPASLDLADYEDVGVTGVTAANLGSVNAMVAAAPKGEGGRLSPEEVQQLAHMGTDWQGPRSAADDVTVEKTDDGWLFKVYENHNVSPDRIVTYSFNAEGEISEIQRDRNADGDMNKADRDRYEVVNEVNDKGEPVKITYYHPKDNGSRETDPYLIHRYKKGDDGLVDVEFSDSDADGTTDVIYFRRPASLDLADDGNIGLESIDLRSDGKAAGELTITDAVLEGIADGKNDHEILVKGDSDDTVTLQGKFSRSKESGSDKSETKNGQTYDVYEAKADHDDNSETPDIVVGYVLIDEDVSVVTTVT